ncbi:MAG: hypothetical protein FJZ90_08920 [Chloroflexi bacterium]|nr:hypothetical protein [Chloroflexota bacterium]
MRTSLSITLVALTLVVASLSACDLTASPGAFVTPAVVPTPTRTLEPTPMATLAPFALQWERRTRGAGDPQEAVCERLAIGEENRVAYGPCDAEARIATLTADDGVRLYINDQLLIDEWHEASPGAYYQKDIPLPTGTYILVVEYYEREGSARVGAGWSYLHAIEPNVEERIPR